MQSSKIIASLFFKMLKKDDAIIKIITSLIWKMMQSSKIIASLISKHDQTGLAAGLGWAGKGWAGPGWAGHHFFFKMLKKDDAIIHLFDR